MPSVCMIEAASSTRLCSFVQHLLSSLLDLLVHAMRNLILSLHVANRYLELFTFKFRNCLVQRLVNRNSSYCFAITELRLTWTICTVYITCAKTAFVTKEVLVNRTIETVLHDGFRHNAHPERCYNLKNSHDTRLVHIAYPIYGYSALNESYR